MSTTEPLTLLEMAKRLGWTGTHLGQKLRRYLKRRERETGEKIVNRDAHPWTVTEAHIRRYCPELRRTKADEVAQDVARFLGRIDERIAERVAERIEQHVEPQLEELRQVDAELSAGLKGLADRVEMVAGLVGDSVSLRQPASR